MKYTPKTKPFPHQARATRRALAHRSYALFMEPRLGKTKAALDYVGMCTTAWGSSRTLVICPLFATDVWISELHKHYALPWQAETVDEEWGTSSPSQFYFINREKLSRRFRKKGGSYQYPYVDQVEAFNPDFIIVDESHLFKRSGGVASQALWRMVRRLRAKSRYTPRKPWVLLLTGTPNPKGWIDLFAQFRIMDEDVFGTTRSDFEERYCTYGWGSRRYTIVKYHHTRELLRKVNDHSYSVTAGQVGMAGRQFSQILWATLPQSTRAAYNEMAEQFITEVEGEQISASNAGVKRLRLLQIAGGFTTEGKKIHGAKVAVLKDYLQNLFDQGERVVIYARFTPEVGAALETAKSVGYKSLGVQGSTKPADRRNAVAALQGGKDPVALVFQVQVGALSIELSRAAEVIFYSLPDSWDLYFQARQRVLGPNQTRPVRYTHILARRTVDRSVLSDLARKEDWHGTLMKDPRRYLYGGHNATTE